MNQVSEEKQLPFVGVCKLYGIPIGNAIYQVMSKPHIVSVCGTLGLSKVLKDMDHWVNIIIEQVIS